MPCGAKPRGFADLYIPWSDWTQNNPCGAKSVTSIAGVDVSAAALCQFHWQLANGQAAFKAPIVLEP
jgi:hypothetical protein